MATSVKKYLSKKWLYKRYVIEKKNIDEIAKECDTSKMTISRYLKIHEIKTR